MSTKKSIYPHLVHFPLCHFVPQGSKMQRHAFPHHVDASENRHTLPFPQEPVTTICCLIKRLYWFLMLSANSQHVLVSCTGSANHAETVPLLGRSCTREPLKHCQGSKNLFLDASANRHSIRCQQELVNTICCKISRSKRHHTGPCCFGTDPHAKTVQILGHSCT